MDKLQLTTIRIPSRILQDADGLAAGHRWWKRAEVLRLALWFGMQIVRKHPISQLHNHWFESEMGRGHYDIHIEWRKACSM